MARTDENEVVRKIRERGYWEVAIQPMPHDASRIERLNLVRDLVGECKVSLRGWDFPHITHAEDFVREEAWQGQAVAWGYIFQTWRVYKSGQFVFLGGIRSDWMDQPDPFGFYRSVEEGKVERILSIPDVLFILTEIYDFASRWGKRLEVPSVRVHHAVLGLENRALVVNDPRRVPFFGPPVASAKQWKPEPQTYQSEELLSRGREIALEHAGRLFELFGLDLGVPFLREWRDSLLRG